LKHGENSEVNLVTQSALLLSEDHARARTSEGFVSGGRYNIGILEGIICLLSSYKATNVGHISEKVSSNFIANGSVALVVKVSGIG
jgi:hypothetical protein